MKYPLLTSIEVGTSLLPAVKHISQDKINRFGVATGSTGAVHVDPEYCSRTALKTTLAHGFLTMAYLSEMMENNFGMDWMTSGELDIKFIGAARAGDSVIVSGQIVCAEPVERGTYITCDVSVVNQNGVKALVGTASLIKTTIQ